MEGWGTTTGGDGGLVVTISGHDWTFLLRRADLKPDAHFLRDLGKHVSPSDVSVFLPNWPSLQWKKVPDNLLARFDSSAVDREFSVTVTAGPEPNEKSERVPGA